ncbi:hypothetical protein [Candidatus Arsenophonus triatominarum]|uniref:hypothetical protein n=1 Tax=Candidatus Arsenophonus triatominarum TaxID=57911 RepID=UPI0007C50CE4|nr:hypothetical protein [Candidatus Arsenophonus triatominarum]
MIRTQVMIPLNTALRAHNLELDIEIANAKVGPWLERVTHQRIHGTTLEKPANRLAKEVKYLLPLPARVCQSISQTNTLNVRIVPPLESVNLQHSISVYEALLGGEHIIA